MNSKDPAADSRALRRQQEIYVAGLSGAKPGIPVDSNRLEAEAERIMTPEAFAYVAGAAGTESTLRANRRAFRRCRILPRVLRDVSLRDTSVELFGQKLPGPFLLAPIGVLELAHEEADLAVARAAAETGVPMVFSNQASAAMEACAEAMGKGPRWFQLYWSRSDDLVKSFIYRAEACGCGALVVTLDTTLLGWRPRDLDLAYLPFLLGKGIAQYVTDPVFLQLLEQPSETKAEQTRVVPRLNLSTLKALVQTAGSYPGGLAGNLLSGKPLAAVRKFIQIYSRPGIQWEDLAFLRDQTRLPVLLKGILHPEDARKAVACGVDGIIVSNHGGRQVDGAVASLDVLPGVADAVGGRIPVLFDSGIRCGADAFKALALGAAAVCIGRPYVYALALAGQTGVRELIRNYEAEFELTMALAGCRRVEEIGRESVVECR